MEFTTKKQNILPALERVNKITKNVIMPILENVLLKANGSLQVIATNLKISIKEEKDIDIYNSGEVVVNNEKLFSIIKQMPDDEIKFLDANNTLKVWSGENIQFEFLTVDPAEYPNVNFDIKETTTLNGDVLRETIKKTIYTCSKNDSYIDGLRGVFLKENNEVLQAIATDGSRLTIIERKLNTTHKALRQGIILPREDYSVLKDILHGEIEFGYQNNQVYLKDTTKTLVIRTLDNEFPNYQVIINRVNGYGKKIIINREQFLRALKRTSIVSGDKKFVRLDLNENSITIAGNDPVFGSGKEKIIINNDIKETIGLNVFYLIEAVSYMDSQNIIFSFEDPESPVVLQPENDENYKAIIMPVELDL
jgi:DNA polymerase-3 subunit beta